MIFRTRTIPATDYHGTQVEVSFDGGEVDRSIVLVAWDYSVNDAHKAAVLEIAHAFGNDNRLVLRGYEWGVDSEGGVLFVDYQHIWE